jgi:hypothetical protein
VTATQSGGFDERLGVVDELSSGQKRVVIVGATGMVGGYAFRYALEHLAVGRATAIGRCGTLSTLDPDCHAGLKAC